MTSERAAVGPSTFSSPAPSGRRSYLSLMVLLIGFLLSFISFQIAYKIDQQRVGADFTRESESLTAELLGNIHNYQQVITALKVLFNYSNDVTRSEFRGAAEELGAQYPGIQALEWVPRIPHQQRAAYEAQVQAEGFSNFRIMDRQPGAKFSIASPRDEYWPIHFAEPMTTNAAVLGYNLLSAPTVEILKQARDEGVSLATHAFRLAQETEGALGWIIVEPIYSTEFPAGHATDLDGLFAGFIQGVFRLPDMLNATWANKDSNRLDAMIVDITTDAQQIIYFHPSSTSLLDLQSANLLDGIIASDLHHFIDSPILGRVWRFYFHPGEAWLQNHTSYSPYFILSSCLALTLLMVGLVHFQLRRTELVEAMVLQRTEELTLSNDRLRLAMRSGKMCAWEWDAQTDAFATISVDPNSPCRFIYQAPTRARFLDNIHPQDRLSVREAGELVIAGEIASYNKEFRVPDEQANSHWVAEYGLAIQDKQGKVSKIIGVARDITTEKQAEREKNDALILLDTLLSSAPVGMSLLDTRLHYLRVNNAICDFLGRRHEDIIGKAVSEILSPRMSNTVMPLLTRVMESRQPILNYELHDEQPDAPGEARYWLANYYPVLGSEGELQGIGTVLVDVTDKRRAEAEIRKSSERFELLAKATNDFVWDWNIETGVIWRNMPEAECLPEHNGNISDFESWQTGLHPDDRERVVNSLLAAVEGTDTEWQEGYRTVTSNGAITHVYNRGYIVRDDQGRAIRVIGAKTDVTEQKEFEQRINQLNVELERRVEIRTSELRMALDELESFSYTVSHDLRAPLRTVNGFANIMREDQDQLSEENRHHLARICSASQHMDQLITDLLRLARISRQDMEIEEVDITAMAHKIVTDLYTEFPDHHPRVEIEPGLSAYCDLGLTRILLINLLNNAFKFTQRVDNPQIELRRVKKAKKDRVSFYLKDNGAGFNMQYSKQLFSPFRRLHTSQEFEGTGIGLATVRRIARRHGGDVKAESSSGSGTTFTFWFHT